ncbi:sensor histidine kinase [Nucisporomicrobium flavum]|uniref:sensor histidine kinase n=1 Tax=Nucisporomicrobium flavum TaxID=2785915 RepID=UPI0018F6C0FB|nr:HAMP domain-containing sensor histidine kinase [Nucisporomicrobium flavum]
MVVLLTVLGLVVGATAEIYLHNTLYKRLDTQLQETAGRAQKWPGFPGGEPHLGGGQFSGRVPPGARDGSIFLNLTATGGVDGGIVTLRADDEGFPNFQYTPLPGATVTQLSAVTPNNDPTDVDLGDLGDYRVVSTTTQDGVVVAALPLKETDQTLLAVALVTGGAVLLALVAAGWAGAVIIRRTLKPLNRVAATATRVSELELDRGEVDLAQRVPEADTDPRTEVGAVGAALNRMLDHVGNALEARHASETQVRQFVADASHELRTPLAAIRGYAELSRRSRQPVPDEIRHVLGRVESEAKRMTALVEDLLLLARLDAGRPLAHDPVDLTMLVVNSVSDAHAAGPRHDWQLDLPEEPVTVTGDEQRLHQVLANLLANARTHTPEGTTVTVGVGQEQGAAVIRVTDAGPGIPRELQPKIFERFARGDSSRSRAAGSTGLGLSIVHAVVSAHGGTVDVDSVPGRTEFTVRLPAGPELQAAPEPVHEYVTQVVQ